MDYIIIFDNIDVMNYIADYLCYVDLWSLTIAYPPLKEYISAKYYDVNKIIFKRLEEIFGNNIKKIMDNLIKYDHYISGSFLLQCIYDVKWNSDIDIYCLNEFNFIDLKDINDDNLFFLKTLYELNDFKQTQEAHNYHYLPVTSRSYSYNEYKIDHVIVKPFIESYKPESRKMLMIPEHKYDNVFQFIDRMFDIDLCKIVYDGKKLYIKNPYDLFTRSSIAHSRLTDYIRSSFWWEETINLLELLDIVLGRIDKYRDRGFKIDTDFDVDNEIYNSFDDMVRCVDSKEFGVMKYGMGYFRIPKRMKDKLEKDIDLKIGQILLHHEQNMLLHKQNLNPDDNLILLLEDEWGR